MAEQQQQQQQQGPFPLAGSSNINSTPDTDMSPAWVSAPAGAAGAGNGGSRQGGMADLEQALGLAAAWFDGDAGAAQWAAAAGDGVADPPSPTGVPRWQEGSEALDGDELLQDLQLPDLDQQQQGQEGQQQGGSWLDNLRNPDDAVGLGSSSLLLLQELPLGSAEDPTVFDTASGRTHAAAGAAAAAGVAQGLQHMHLDDIDAELADSVAPGQLMCRLLPVAAVMRAVCSADGLLGVMAPVRAAPCCLLLPCRRGPPVARGSPGAG